MLHFNKIHKANDLVFMQLSVSLLIQNEFKNRLRVAKRYLTYRYPPNRILFLPHRSAVFSNSPSITKYNDDAQCFGPPSHI